MHHRKRVKLDASGGFKIASNSLLFRDRSTGIFEEEEVFHALEESKLGKDASTKHKEGSSSPVLSSRGSAEWQVPGALCQVYSKSHNGWMKGEITAKTQRKKGSDGQFVWIVTVEFNAENEWLRKEINQKSPFIRPLTAERLTDKCICGGRLRLARSKGARRCSICTAQRVRREEDNEQWFKCPNTDGSVHKYGFVICGECMAHNRMPRKSRIPMHRSIRQEAGDYLSEHSEKPFAKGSMRYVYFGRYLTAEKYGLPCVIKKFKRKHAFSSDEWDADIKCMEYTRTFVAAWNKRFTHESAVGQSAADKLLDPFRDLSAAKPKRVVLKVVDSFPAKVCQSAAEKLRIARDGEEAADELREMEHVLVEDYIPGAFLKWNSNGGWRRQRQEKLAVEAFCHWTYHASDGALLVTDIQGVRFPKEYWITDPAILSHTKGGFGVTDAGLEAIHNWFPRTQVQSLLRRPMAAAFRRRLGGSVAKNAAVVADFQYPLHSSRRLDT